MAKNLEYVMNKKNLNYLLFFLFFLTFSCVSGNEDIKLIEKVSNTGITLSEKDFTDSGFKINKNYDISELTNAISAVYGWKNIGEEETKDFEIRIYDSHENAVNFGKSFADEATGEDAIIRKRDASWKEGIKDRRTISTPTDGGSIGAAIGSNSSPKYGDYIIYENLIILCEGHKSEESLRRCTLLVESIQK